MSTFKSVLFILLLSLAKFIGYVVCMGCAVAVMSWFFIFLLDVFMGTNLIQTVFLVKPEGIPLESLPPIAERWDV